MGELYYRQAKAALVCFDITDRPSWDKVEFWISELKLNEPDCMVAIVANKCDLLEEGKARCISEEEVREYLETVGGFEYYETSAKNGENVDTPFIEIAQEWMSVHGDMIDDATRGFIANQKPQNDSDCAC
eukprot:TRINITY_DN1385_c0_g1_i1.p1 TRINITY_DN1385_c0_g1~~TRINITY_DN1385_c0_g1_i1.p1  ORF type:complete len:130 (-),score=27.62 TRINITY_DN1385_c0_g1_i1:364-753(-)